VAPDVAARERAIIRHLKMAGRQGATARQIYEVVSEELADTVTLQAYHKVIDRLRVAGKIDVLTGEERNRTYSLTPALHSGNAISLDDVYQLLPFLETSESIARAIDAVDYYEENRASIIRRAAEALCEEDPVDLFLRMIKHKVELIMADVRLVRGEGAAPAETADALSESRLDSDYRDLEHVCYRALSLPREAIDLPSLNKLRGKDGQTADIAINDDLLIEAVRLRVFGQSFLREIDVSDQPAGQRDELVVSASDGSMHAGALALKTARNYLEDVTDVITFNNSIGYARVGRRRADLEGRRDMVYSVPFTRDALDDPSSKGMVLAQFMYPELSEAEYEHMARCATDVVQFRVDEMMFAGGAGDIISKQPIPRPQVHLRDGTITPQEREFGHYQRPDAYGQMVREGIRLERRILDRILTSPHPPVFGGAVKATQMRIFGQLLNWYISIGSRDRFGEAIEPNWNSTRAAGISDNAAMTNLLASIAERSSPGRRVVSCAVLRQFPSLTEFYSWNLREMSWLDFMEEKKRQALADNARHGSPLPYHATVDLADDDFVFMCERADYLSFYIGHTGGDPAPTLPRYEFLTSLRAAADHRDASAHVEDRVRRIVDAIEVTGLSADRDHNYLTGKTLVKIIPYVIYQAHEHAKSLGRSLEAQLRSIVISRLAELKRLRASPSDLVLRPVSLRDYLLKYARARRRENAEPDDFR
jgi:hypothetical protein